MIATFIFSDLWQFLFTGICPLLKQIQHSCRGFSSLTAALLSEISLIQNCTQFDWFQTRHLYNFKSVTILKLEIVSFASSYRYQLLLNIKRPALQIIAGGKSLQLLLVTPLVYKTVARPNLNAQLLSLVPWLQSSDQDSFFREMKCLSENELATKRKNGGDFSFPLWKILRRFLSRTARGVIIESSSLEYWTHPLRYDFHCRIWWRSVRCAH